MPEKVTHRRQLLLAAAACLLLAGPFVVRWAMTPAPGVTLENFKRLHEGMTFEQVEAIMGRLPDQTQEFWGAPPVTTHEWKKEKATILITRTRDGNIVDGVFDEGGNNLCNLSRAPESLRDKIRRWLGL